MPTYISLLNWTEQGIKNYKDTVGRAREAGETIAGLGGSMRDVFYTLGPYDCVTIVDFPDDESATAALLELGSLGNVRSTTMRAFSRDEMTRVIERAS
jgi:uncharacterized protein with GYD domain